MLNGTDAEWKDLEPKLVAAFAKARAVFAG
jgi:hypothetical protein